MFVLICASWLAFSVIAGVWAAKKNLSGYDYFLLSLAVSPVVGFAIILLKTRVRREDRNQFGHDI